MVTQDNYKKLIVIVGGSSGLGFAALESLLSSGTGPFHIVLGSRRPLDAQHSSKLSYHLQSSHSSFDRLEVDFSSYASVHSFAEALKTKYVQHPIDALVLCAGKIGYYHKMTKDGVDETLQVNVLSHALLVDLLEQKIGENGSKARVLFVESGLHRKVLPGTLRPDTLDVALGKNYEAMSAYQITKFLQMYLVFFAQERFADRPNVTVVAVSPGFVPDTGLNRELGMLQHGIMSWVLPRTPFATTIADGGKNIARGITDSFPSGTYFSQRHVEKAAEECYDPDLRRQWKAWFISKRVWHQESEAAIEAIQVSQQTLSRAETQKEVAEWQGASEPTETAEAEATSHTTGAAQPESQKVETLGPEAAAPTPADAEIRSTAAPAPAPAPSAS